VQPGCYGTLQWIGMIAAREKKSKAVFSASALPRSGGCRRKLEHKDVNNGQEESSCIERIGVEG